MHKTARHISKLFCSVIVIALCSFPLYATAQEEDFQLDTVAVDEEEKAPNFDALTDEDKVAVNGRKLTDTEINRLKKEDDFWYADEAPQRKKPKPAAKPRENIFTQLWFRNLMWFIIVGSFIVIVVWFLLSSNVRLFQKTPKKIAHETAEPQTENIFDIQYETEISKAVAAKNFPLAIRLLYLQLLKELSAKNLIQYKQGRTNSEYVFGLAGTNYYRDFFRLTRNFDYASYGHFPVSEEAFQTIRADFATFKQRLH